MQHTKRRRKATATHTPHNPHTIHNTPSEDVLLAVTALEELKGQSPKTDKTTHTTKTKQSHKPTHIIPDQHSNSHPDSPTLFDKMISHPIISNSINYVLEKTSSTSTSSTSTSPPVPAEPSTSTAPTRKRKFNQQTTSQPPKKRNLRQQASISSAISIQRSLTEVKQLSTLNLNIESRKKLTMLIHFLKLGNSQLSDRINKLLDSVDTRKEQLGLKDNQISTSTSSTNQSTSNSPPLDINIQKIKSEIVSTVKKIVNVVSTVSAQSLSEPARSNVRELLLKLPTNWATVLNTYDKDSDSVDDSNSDSHSDSDSDSHSHANPDDAETITVTNSELFQKRMTPSISTRLLNNLLEYQKLKGEEFTSNRRKFKQWFNRKIRSHFLHDSNSGKVLILAEESLDMVNKIIAFCNESLEKADNWNTDKQIQHEIELSNILKPTKDNVN